MSAETDKVEGLLALITQLEAQHADIASRHDATIATALKAKTDELEPITKQLSKAVTELQVFADTNRTKLISKGQKTCEVPHGRLRWKKCPDSVEITDDVELVIARLQKARRDDALRVVTTIDKNKVRAKPELIKGIRGIKIKPGDEQLMIETDNAKYTARED